MSYEPRPISVDHIDLPESLKPLVEHLAEHVHDMWAQKRMSEGWTWGPARNDHKKQHPDLVPYKDLAESEKEYDRRSVIATLKATLALGYRIEKS